MQVLIFILIADFYWDFEVIPYYSYFLVFYLNILVWIY